MKATVLSVRDFLKFKCPSDESFFIRDIKNYAIPKFQREYKWKSNMIEDLFNDVEDKAKFLGIIALEQKETVYEIVDGQQRLTTIFLMLVELFNYFGIDETRNEDQMSIFSYIFDPNLIIKNDTIGNFLNVETSCINISISDQDDIYRQGKTFESITSIIKTLFSDRFSKVDERNIDRTKLAQFKRKLLDCKLLVFINNSLKENESTEEIYVDINQKSQHLDVEDIYKGYCFQKTDKEHHENLKELWVNNKSLSFYFQDNFGLKDFDNLLYIYYLSQPSTFKITQDLTKNKRHILNDATSSDVFRELRNIKSYCSSVKKAFEKVKTEEYFFSDVTSNASHYRGTFDYKLMKIMIKGILSYNHVQYHKLPFFVFLEKLYSEYEDIPVDLSFDELRKVITNYYIYSIYFIQISKKKNKSGIEQDNISTINNIKGRIKEENIINIIKEIKDIRRNMLDSEEVMAEKFNKQEAYDLYAILDLFEQSNQKLKGIYSLENGYNDEHFLIHQNKKIEWLFSDQNKFTIDISKYKKFKEKLINHLILPRDLNESLESYDIVEKIFRIKEFFTKEQTLLLPRHIEFFIKNIESMQEYNEIKKLKEESNRDNLVISKKYFEFLDVYFGNENGLQLRQSLLNQFKTL